MRSRVSGDDGCELSLLASVVSDSSEEEKTLLVRLLLLLVLLLVVFATMLTMVDNVEASAGKVFVLAMSKVVFNAASCVSSVDSNPVVVAT